MRHETSTVKFWLCSDCEGIWFGFKFDPVPDDMLGLYLTRNQYEIDGLLEVEENTDKFENIRPEARVDRVGLLQSNRMLAASDLARLLAKTSYFGVTYTLLFSAFHEAFPEIPESVLGSASVKWCGVGGQGSDDEFDLALSRWIGREGSKG